MSYQDLSGDTLTSGNAGIPPLVEYGAESTLYSSAGSDAIPTSMMTPSGAEPAMGAPEPTAAPQNLGAPGSPPAGATEAPIAAAEEEMEQLEDESWTLRRAGLIAGVVATGLAVGAGIGWFLVSRRRAEQARLAAVAAAQLRAPLRITPAVALQRLNEAVDSGSALTAMARESVREASLLAAALAESALATAQEARERAIVASQLLRDQTLTASQLAQERFSGTWGKTRDTATTSWEGAQRTAKIARQATMRTAKTARAAAKSAARTAREEGKRTARVARAEFNRAQRVATR